MITVSEKNAMSLSEELNKETEAHKEKRFALDQRVSNWLNMARPLFSWLRNKTLCQVASSLRFTRSGIHAFVSWFIPCAFKKGEESLVLETWLSS